MTLAGRSGTTWLVWVVGCVYGNSYMTSGQQLVTVFGSYLEEVCCWQVFDVAILSVRKVCTCHG